MRFVTLVKSLHSRLLFSWKIGSAMALCLGFASILCVSLVVHWKETRAGEEKPAAAGADRQIGAPRVINLDVGGGPFFHLDGKRLLMAAGSEVRDLGRNKVLYKVPAHKGGAAIIFSPDGKHIATAAMVYVPTEPRYDMRYDLRLRDAASGGSVALLFSTEVNIYYFAFSPDGTRIAASVTEHRPTTVAHASIILWDPRTGDEIRRLRRPREDDLNSVRQIVFHPDNKLLIASDSLYFWDFTQGKLLREVKIGGKNHDANATDLAVSPDGKLLAVADAGRGNPNTKLWAEQTSPIRLLELPSGKEVAVLDGHPHPLLSSIAFRRDGRWLASVGGDHTVKIWDIPKRKLLYTLNVDKEARCVAFSPDDRWLAVKEYQRILLYELIPATR